MVVEFADVLEAAAQISKEVAHDVVREFRVAAISRVEEDIEPQTFLLVDIGIGGLWSDDEGECRS